MRTGPHSTPGPHNMPGRIVPAPLAPLVERLAALSAPCPTHPAAHRIEAEVAGWAHGTGLDSCGGAHLLAGRAFASADLGAATLFARWLAWLPSLRRRPRAFAGVLATAAGAEPGPAPVERAFADLWRACAPGMSDRWRERFLAGLTAQRAALLRAGPPSADDYPALGRARFGRYLFDVVEPCLGVEVPAAIRESRQWGAAVEASGDVVTWCDDLVAGDGYVTVAPGGRGGEPATEWVVGRVVTRVEELWTATRAIPAVVERSGLGFAASREVVRVACALLTIPRAYLERLLESPRSGHVG